MSAHTTNNQFYTSPVMSSLPYQDQPSEADHAKVAAELALAEQTRAADLKWLMSSPRGRRVVWWILEFAGVDRLSFNTNGSVMSFNEGMRNVGQMLKGNVLEHCEDRFFEMLKEHRKE